MPFTKEKVVKLTFKIQYSIIFLDTPTYCYNIIA